MNKLLHLLLLALVLLLSSGATLAQTLSDETRSDVSALCSADKPCEEIALASDAQMRLINAMAESCEAYNYGGCSAALRNEPAFKSVKDVLAPFLAKQCLTESVSACLVLAQNITAQKNNRYQYDWDDKIAVPVLRDLCIAGEQKACLHAAELDGKYDDFSYRQDDYDWRPDRIFAKACEDELYVGCYYLGDLYDDGYLVRESDQKAQKYYTKACDADSGLGCAALGLLYFRSGHTPKVDADGNEIDHKAVALEYYKRACDLGNSEACMSAYQKMRVDSADQQAVAEKFDYYCKAVAFWSALMRPITLSVRGHGMGKT